MTTRRVMLGLSSDVPGGLPAQHHRAMLLAKFLGKSGDIGLRRALGAIKVQPVLHPAHDRSPA